MKTRKRVNKREKRVAGIVHGSNDGVVVLVRGSGSVSVRSRVTA